MPYLVSYDIENDKYRKKISDRLLEIGFIRLQKSVFAGDVKERLVSHFEAWFKKELLPNLQPDDKLLILTLTRFQLEDFRFLAAQPPEWEDLKDPPNTLFI